MLKYHSGEEIRAGDRVNYHGEPGEIEFVVDVTGDPALDWYRQEFGSGVMVAELKVFGKVFVSDVEHDEDLEFVARGE